MKPSVILSLFAVILMALCATTAQANVNVQLNLRYTDPADPSEGGTWDLLVQSSAANGLAGVRLILDGISGAITPNAPVFVEATSIFKSFATGVGTEIEVVAGDDLDGALITLVGTGAGPGNVALDDLFSGNQPTPDWDNSALIASGSFTTATRPTIVSVDANEFDIDPNSISVTVVDIFTVRGDSLESLGLEDPSGVPNAGLLIGDASRDGEVAGTDLLTLLPNLGSAGGWDDGDFNDDDIVAGADLLALLPNLGSGGIPPAIRAVPEPASLTLLVLAGLGIVLRRRV